MLTLIGGCLGILLGAGGAALISLLVGWRTSISLRTVLFAVGISAGVGLVFGMYPAAQGAAMDPVVRCGMNNYHEITAFENKVILRNLVFKKTGFCL